VNILLALRFYGVGDIRVENIPNPICNPKEALVKVKYAGICGSDLHIFKGVIIEITGALVDHATHDFTEGFNSVITNYPQLKVVQGEGKWNNEDSFNRTTDLLMRFGDEVVAIYIHTPDIMSPGVISAIEKQGYDPSKFSIAGVWAGPEGLQFIREGKISAIVAPPAMTVAELSVQYLYDLKSGKKIPQIGDM
jgi:ribose transport system substrate-binding protein